MQRGVLDARLRDLASEWTELEARDGRLRRRGDQARKEERENATRHASGSLHAPLGLGIGRRCGCASTNLLAPVPTGAIPLPDEEVMRRRHPGLRTILTTTTLGVVALAVGVSISLAVVVHRLHIASENLAAAVESIRLTDEAQIDLLLHARTVDLPVRRDLERDLRRALEDLAPFVTSGVEARVLEDVTARVERYFDAARGSALGSPPAAARLDEAYAGLERLVDTNVLHAREARARVTRWDTLASGVGFGTAALLLIGSGCFVWWLRARAFRPVFGLLRSMERFGRGDRDVRAEETGPAELHALAQRFNEMAAALVAQRQAQMNVLGGVAHDLRGPLGALKLGLASVSRQATLPPEPRIRRMVEMAERQVARMERMVGDFLDTARIEAGKLDLSFDWRDAREIVGEVASLFEGTSSKHQLVVDLPPNEVWVRCDALRLEQVLGNLLSNALKFSPDGGQVRVQLRRDNDEAVVSVEDSGVGISEEDQGRLFEPYRRVGPNRDTIPGIGLGLFVVHQLVQAHGGRIEVESAPGRGTTFSVRLPSAGEPAAPGLATASRRANEEHPRPPSC